MRVDRSKLLLIKEEASPQLPTLTITTITKKEEEEVDSGEQSFEFDFNDY